MPIPYSVIVVILITLGTLSIPVIWKLENRLVLLSASVSWLVFFVALWLPTLYLANGNVLTGDYCLSIGFAACFLGDMSWYANLFYLVAIGCLLGARCQTQYSATTLFAFSMVFGLFAVGLALAPRLSSGVILVPVGWSGLHGTEMAAVVGCGPGFYLWISALVLIPLLALGWCLASWMSRKRVPQGLPHARSDTATVPNAQGVAEQNAAADRPREHGSSDITAPPA